MKKNKIIKWKVKKSILKTGDYKLNNHIASKISKKGFKKIIKHYTDITPQNIKKILKKNKNYKNDEGLKEYFVNFKFGGFEKKKVMYLLGVVK